MPIGLLRATKGSPVVEMWLSEATILNDPGLKPLGEKLRTAMNAYQEAKKLAVAAGKQSDAADFPPHPPSEASPLRPRFSTRYNSMIAPFAGMALRGIVWYQAETNSLNPQIIAAYPAARGDGDTGDFLVVRVTDKELIVIQRKLGSWGMQKRKMLGVPATHAP